MNIQAIADRTKLCVLTCGAWRATRKHRAETEAVNARHGTHAARVSVTLTDHSALTALGKLHAAAYVEHVRLTLPSVQDGMRLLPAGREFEHSDAMRKFSAEHDRLAAAFLADYDAERAAAPGRLNGLYDARMWPARAVVEDKFRFSTRYLSCPVDGPWADWLGESARAATDELRDRLTSALRHMYDVCRGDGKIYSSLVENLREVCELVPDLNVADVADINALAADAAELGGLDPDGLRENKTARREAADKAGAILRAFNL